MRILLTGVTGYLGSHLAETLLANGCEVVALKRATSSLRRIEHLLSQLTLHDVNTVDMDALFTQDGKIDAVIHTATCYGRNGESASQIADANLAFPLKLLNVAVEAKVKLFINTDTVLDKFLNPYALTKAQFAEWGRYFSTRSELKFINLKLEHFYGPNDDASKFTTHVINSCLANTDELKLTLGEQKRDFVYISDVVSAYSLILDKWQTLPEQFAEFEVGSGQAITIREFVETAHRLANSSTQLLFGAIPYRKGEVMLSQAHIDALRLLGWGCEVDIETGMKHVINFQRKL